MELMIGGQLFERIKDKSQIFSEREIAMIMKQVCQAVNHLHVMGIAHRDLKPENLLFSSRDKDAIIKLIDFGFAKEEILNLNSPCFTPYYVAPEICKSETYDSKCDIWALGVIMYMLCYKRPPFYSHSGEPLSPGMKKRIMKGYYSFPSKKRNDLSNDVKEVIKAMLDIDPNTRATIDEILNSDWLKHFTQLPSSPPSKLDESKEKKILECVNELSETQFINQSNNEINQKNDEIIKLKSLSITSAESNSLLQRRLNKKKHPSNEL